MAGIDPRNENDPRIARLYELGEPSFAWYEKPDLGFSANDIPLLREVAIDLKPIERQTGTEWAAPIHAWHVLGHLPAEQALPVLFEVLEIPWSDLVNWNAWRGEALTSIIANFGEPSIGQSACFLSNQSRPMLERGAAGEILRKTGMERPELRDQCAQILTDVLRGHADNPPRLNALVVCFLVDLRAGESVDVVREAYNAGNVAEEAAGSLEGVEIDLGVREGVSDVEKAVQKRWAEESN